MGGAWGRRMNRKQIKRRDAENAEKHRVLDLSLRLSVFSASQR